MLAILMKNVRLFLADRKGLAISLALPIVLATITGLAFSGVGKKKGPRRLALAVTDLDRSAESRKLADALEASEQLAVTRLDAADDAREGVRRREYVAALVIHPGAGRRLRELFYAEEKARFTLYQDPSRQMEAGLLQGVLMEKTMQSVTAGLFDADGARANMQRGLEALGGPAGDEDEETRQLRAFLRNGLAFFDSMPGREDGEGPGGEAATERLSRPFELEVESVSGSEEKQKASFHMMAQTFSGMGVMFLLFTVLDGALAFVRERSRGTLARLRAAPVSKASILLGESGAYFLIGLGQLVILFAFGTIVFGIPFYGSKAGLVLVALATCWAVTGFGLAIAALGRTEKQVQGISILVILVMSALGGSWFPLWLMPDFMQAAASFTITKWSVMGFEAVTWRGLGLDAVLLPAAVLAGIGTALFAGAMAFCRWE